MNANYRFTVQTIMFGVIAVLFIGILFAYSEGENRSSSAWAYGTTGDKLIEKTFDVQPGGNFTLRTNQGSINIEGWERDEVAVRIEFSGESKYVDDVDVSMSQTGDTIDIQVEVPRSNFRLFGTTPRVRLNFVVMAPHAYNIDVRTAGGSLNVAGLTGDLRGYTSGGSIRTERIGGTVDFRTSGGSIKSNEAQGNVSYKTSGGGIYVERAKGELEVKTSGGRIELKNIEARVDASTSGGGIEMVMSGENRGISLRTSGGGIKIHLPDDIRANLSAKTSGGSVSSDLPVMVQGSVGRSTLEGTINGGGPDVVLRTSGGSIRIQSR